MKAQQLSVDSAASLEAPTPDNAPILAIFAKSSWNCDMSDERYEALKPSMRLASRFLTSKQIRPMFHTMLSHGPRQDLGEKDSDGNAMETYQDDDCRVDREMGPAAFWEIEAALAELADFVEFKTHDVGCLTKIRQGGPGRLDTTLYPEGVPSTIYLPHASLNQPLGAHAAPLAQQDLPLLIVKPFELAIQLTHEVCHALQNHLMGDLTTESFFGHGAAVAETGYEAEYRLLGGQFSIIWASSQDAYPYRVHELYNGQLSELTGIPILWRWPCRGTSREYSRRDWGLWERERYTREAPENDIAWRVSIEDLHRYFTSAFWTQANQSENLAALHLPKEVGYPFRFDKHDTPWPATIHDQDLIDRGITGFRVDEDTWDIVMADT